MRAADLMPAAVARLRDAGIEGAPRDARLLMAHALDIPADRLTLALHDPLPEGAAARFEQAIAARLRRQPVSQILGWRDFFGRRFRVTPDVLDPRPETETLVAAALEEPFARVLDLGTGTGAILLTLLAETDATGLGVDLSPAALDVARDNARLLGLSDRARFAESDWYAAVPGQFDLIVSNPPYIAAAEMEALAPEVRDWEPHLALTPGGDGLDAYRAITAGVRAHLAPNGRLALEIGATQGAAVAALVRGAGAARVRVLPDLDGRDRVVLGQWP
ncbi:peptide chain release factor N(5)-glutamine methyltransferase [Plastorhodobacter daqingensis]|uniref:Release factor glutamine methyltransferase n=1 Tax=Plastorhodobacter daqingensis TaxID=1387281 RepID=A0ABW2UM62_9RHOB